ncbi:glycerol-3-phosphate responsive antiterminator [Alteribacillus bidgolensis]|uniref:Glycerol uptake operon antiterminator regulatory protein n=1 Tax=Alteribacillus bidgolensis TaxID=930129 RepID=A0A1G8I696_9BACI|nr:glycerol-3-phosphate responsive antiterminator [Alteribacillus bidgolensis]SDI14468.1 glycerol uptake operon antiterminator [Alteribacillus bidgolensis]
MHFGGQSILPAARSIKEVERLMESDFEYIVLLHTHIGQLSSLVKELKRNHKKVLLHADMVQGLRNDEYAAQFLSQTIRPAGLISTRNNVVAAAKQAGLLAIQRLFLLDSMALETSYRLMQKNKPDYIEVLPGILPARIIHEVQSETGVPLIAGGLIRNKEDVKTAFEGGVVSITTSRSELWKEGKKSKQ